MYGDQPRTLTLFKKIVFLFEALTRIKDFGAIWSFGAKNVIN